MTPRSTDLALGWYEEQYIRMPVSMQLLHSILLEESGCVRSWRAEPRRGEPSPVRGRVTINGLSLPGSLRSTARLVQDAPHHPVLHTPAPRHVQVVQPIWSNRRIRGVQVKIRDPRR